METNNDKELHFAVCSTCRGEGKVTREPSKKSIALYHIEHSQFEANGGAGIAPKPPLGHIDICSACEGSGLQRTNSAMPADFNKFPNIAIIGGGIGGVALAVACLHRGIPFTLYERDESFNSRSQGYGLTLQQASKAIEGLGVFSLSGGVTSTRHVVHNPEGKIIGEWGLRRWKREFIEKTSRRRNVHIARQTVRQLLLQNLESSQSLKWGHALIDVSHNQNGTVDLKFEAGGKQEIVQADLVVGADGIRSKVRELVIGEETAPLKYLGCIVILGICPLKSIPNTESPLLDSKTVFQTVNGHDRMYMMPYDKDTIMWQFSFPLEEIDAKELSARGAQAMKDEVCRRLSLWHDPIPQILEATLASDITGYPVYDRELFDPALLEGKDNVTLLGDAAHPMSPFKGQGANQALLDALDLARKIYAECSQNTNWREVGIRKSILAPFEKEMARRSAVKVESSAKAAELLHSKAVLHDGDEPRGQRLG